MMIVEYGGQIWQGDEQKMLIEALEAVENRRESQEYVPVWRAGVTPMNWVGAQRNVEGMTTCSRGRESQIPQGRAGAFNQLE